MSLLSGIVAISTMTLVACKQTNVVNTSSGPVQGVISTTVRKSVEYASFVGIRYAKPPVEYLRFKPPVPIEPWTNVLNATVEGTPCTQLSLKNVVEGSEDCLFLNVVTPVVNLKNIPPKLRSVMVWIHGGGFKVGSSSTKLYRPDYLVEEDIVYVSVNYRLGAFGFLNLNHPNATGNAGLKDQNLALKWIQTNIKNFGGDPNNVTLFGHSAGAASVGFHTLSDASVGLFHGAICMSGTALVPWAFKTTTKALTTAKHLGVFLGTKSNDKETLLKTFYAASSEAIVRATSVVGETLSWTPTLEDSSLETEIFLSECSIKKYMTGNFTKVPQMLGFVKQESLVFLLISPDVFVNEVKEALEVYPSSVLYELRDSFGSLNRLAKEANESIFEMVLNETSDILYKSLIDFTQSLLVDNNDDKPVYYYQFTFNPNVSLTRLMVGNKHPGVGHNDELSYIFSIPLVDDNIGPDGPVARNIRRISTMWTNFAKYGNPTPHWISDDSLDVTWPTSGRSGRSLNIDHELTVTSRPISLNTEIIKAALRESLFLRNGCTVI